MLTMLSYYLKRFLFSVVFIFFGSFLLSAQTSLKLKFKRSNIYAGIEVGSKGVKMSLIEMDKSSQKNSTYNIVGDTSINTDFISFTPATFSASLKALCDLYNTAHSFYHVPLNRIYTVISSGVKISAQKDDKTKWIQVFIDSFKIKINDPSRRVDVIDPDQEARLSHLGIVPESKRFTTFLIDIGSGNTKGGYFPTDNTDHIKLFQLTWGTQSTANAAINRLDNDNSLNNYNRQLQRVLNGDADKEITYAVNVSGAYNMSDNVAFSGGAAWATATLLYPELVDEQVVPVTYDEVKKMNEKLFTDYPAFSDKLVVSKITNNNVDKDAVAKEIRTVNKVFNQRAMLAASGLLLKIMRQFDGLYEKKQFYLVKNGQVGWISAYVNENIDK
jgi:hypothetical protein